MFGNQVAARRYGSAGLYIIPCYLTPAGKKKPIHRENWKSKASCKLEDIDLWFNRPQGGWNMPGVFVKNEHILIGLLTGAFNQIEVIDIDLKGDINGHLTVPGWELLSSVIVETPSGGHHLYHRFDSLLKLKNETSEIFYNDRRIVLPGVDIRTTGGYVIAPGSTLPDGREYKFVKGHLLTAEDKVVLMTEVNIDGLTLKVREGVGEAKRKRKVLLTVESDPETLYQQRALTWVQKLAGEFAAAGSGTRDKTLTDKLFAAGCTVHHGLVTEAQLVQVFWPSVEANGLDKDDGVTVKTLEQKVRDALIAAQGTSLPDHLRERDWFVELNDKYFVVENEGDKSWVGEWKLDDNDHPFVSLVKFGDFHNRFHADWVRVGDNRLMAGKAWLQHRAHRQYHSLYFDPEGPEVDEHNRYNIWRGFALKSKKGDWRRLRHHIWWVLADRKREIFKYIVRWSAWCLQNPGKPAEVALILRGDQGTGKGLFATSMIRIFGTHGLPVSQSDDLVGKFNDHLRKCCLLFADEAISPRDIAAASRLKALLTEKVLTFQGKFKNQVKGKNVVKVIMASNEAHVSHVECSDRRNAVFDCVLNLETILGGRFKDGIEYHEWLSEGLQDENLAAMLHDLINLRLGRWHPRKGIPDTDAREEQQHLTTNPLQDVLADYLEQEAGLLPWLEVIKLLNIPINQLNQRHKNWIGHSLRELGWQRTRGKERGEDGKRLNVTRYSKGEGLELLTAQDIRDRYEVRQREQQSAAEKRRADKLNGAAAHADDLLGVVYSQEYRLTQALGSEYGKKED